MKQLRRPQDRRTGGQLRLVYSDRVVSRWLDADATLGDVAAALGELGLRYPGHPLAIDVTMTNLPERFQASHLMPAAMTYEDDPAAKFEDAASRSAFFHDPDQSVRVRARKTVYDEFGSVEH